jgi:hypothetical protein
VEEAAQTRSFSAARCSDAARGHEGCIFAEHANAASAFRQACKRNDAKQAIANLQRWFAASGINPHTLSSPAAQQFRTAMQDLEACLYKETKGSRWDGRALLKAFDAMREEAGTQSHHTPTTGNLPPLYQGQQTTERAA